MAHARQTTYNINVGLLGHVDSGKTSLVAALSSQLSTAALDKHPQSKERGITLDLGFSSFTADVPPRLQALKCDQLQVTLVDCPGHASLIRTIIGGAQIIDIMMLIIDITKGIQAQTAECLVVGEIATDKLLVVLNKVDLLPQHNRDKVIAKAQKMLLQTFAHTKFRRPPMVAVSAKPGLMQGFSVSSEGVLCIPRASWQKHQQQPLEDIFLGGGGGFTGGEPADSAQIQAIIDTILSLVEDQPRDVEGKFLMSVDHCFAVKGHGTVLTGTVLQGSARVNDVVELPTLREKKKIKSMQIFKKAQQQCFQGDRVGICVTQLDPSRVERGWLSTPGTVPVFLGAIAALEKIRFYTGPVKSRQKLHATVGHVTVMAEMHFFGLPEGEGEPGGNALQAITSRIGALSMKDIAPSFNLKREYLHQEQLFGLEGRADANLKEGERPQIHYGAQWGLLKFSQPVTAPKDSLVVISRLDEVSTGASCRLALYGRLTALLDPNSPSEMSQLKVYKVKRKEGIIERLLPQDSRLAVCKGFFKKESDFSPFVGLKVMAATGGVGIIESAFGKSGKFRVRFEQAIPTEFAVNCKLFLTFKKFLYDKDRKQIVQ